MTVATDYNALLRVPGRLCVNPNNLSASFPFGGTDLGLVARMRVRPGKGVKKLREENLGKTVTFGIDLGEAWALAAAVRSLEEGHAATFFKTETGSVSGDPMVTHNPVDATKSNVGKLLSTVALLFCPFDELQQFFVYFPAAIAYPDAAAEEEKSIVRLGHTLVAFDATPRASDGYCAIKAKKEDLTL